MKKTLFFLAFIILYIKGYSQTVSLQNVVASAGNVSVDLSFTGLDLGIGAGQFKIIYDETKLTYTGWSNLNPVFVSQDISITNAIPGSFDFWIFTENPRFMEDGVFVKFNFTYTATGCANLTYGPLGQPPYITDGAMSEYSVTWVDGSVCPCTAVSISDQPDNQSMCANTGNASFSVTADGTTPISYQWKYKNGSNWVNVANGTPAGATYTGNTAETLNVSGITAGGSYQYQCYLTNCSGASNATSNTAILTVNTVPPQPSTITGNTPVCQGSSQTYSVTNVAGVTYTWTFPTGWSQTGGGTTNSVTVTVGSGSGNVQVTPSNICGNGTARTKTVTVVSAVPSQPSTITGNTPVCQGSSQTYSVTNVAGNTYAWTFPTGWSQTGGGTTNSVTVTVGSGSGNVQVTPSNVCGNGTARTLAVTTVAAAPSQPSIITGNTAVCQGSSQTYSVTNVAGVTYTWTFPSGWSQTGGGTTNSVTVTVGSGSGNVQVTPSNVCGNGTAQTLAVVTTAAAPSQPSTITGNTPVCQGSSQTYSVTNVAGVTYTWTFPTGWVQTGGGNTNSVIVTVGSGSGNVQVTPSNICGNGTARTKAVTVVSAVPSQPSVITGNTTVCQGSSQTYSVTNVAGTTYTWTFPTGWSQTGGGTTNSITVTVGSGSGNVQVVPSNVCGNGTAQTLAVTTTGAVPSQPSVITGNTPVCQGSSQTYSVTNVVGVTYTWTFPTGWSQTGGGTTNSVTVTVGSGSGNVQVTPSNLCGDGTARTLAVTSVSAVPSQPSAITGNTPVCQGSSQTYSVTNVAGTTYAWTFPTGWSQTGGGTTNSVTVTVGSGSGNMQVTPSNVCGNGTAQTLAVVTTAAAPSQPSTITGNTPVCQGSSQTYSVTNVAGVTYTWTFPTGWVQTDGGNTNSVTVTVGSGSGNVQVTPSNVCGDGTTRTKAVTVESAPQISNQPLKIVTVPGGGGAFSVTSTGATSYTWKVSTNGFAGPYTDISAAGSNPTYSNWTTAVLGITNAQPANNGWIYKCKLTNTCGDITSDTASLIVEETIAPLIINDILVDDDTICLGDSIHLDLVISGGVPPYSYTWSGVGLSSTTIKNPAALPGALGSTTYSVTVTDGTNTQDTSITVFVSGYPTADAGDDKIIGCGTPFTTIGTTAVAGLTYSWEPAADLSNPNAAEPTAMPSATTIYTLTVTNAAGCTDSDEMTVNLITAITVNAGNDTTICAGQEYQLQAVSDYALTFNWTPATGLNYTNINNPVANPEITTTYIITTTAGSCSASDDITITVINMGLTLTYDCNSTMATALPVGLPSYEFSLNDGVVQGESTLNTYYSSSIANNDIISVIAQDESGCIDTVYLTVDCIVELPSAFTPDGDGINDKFPTKYHLPFVLSIFDRWGLLLYYGEEGWDGKHDGKTMSPATYFYKIIITNTDGSKTERTGAVTLVKK